MQKKWTEMDPSEIYLEGMKEGAKNGRVEGLVGGVLAMVILMQLIFGFWTNGGC